MAVVNLGLHSQKGSPGILFYLQACAYISPWPMLHAQLKIKRLGGEKYHPYHE